MWVDDDTPGGLLGWCIGSVLAGLGAPPGTNTAGTTGISEAQSAAGFIAHVMQAEEPERLRRMFETIVKAAETGAPSVDNARLREMAGVVINAISAANGVIYRAAGFGRDDREVTIARSMLGKEAGETSMYRGRWSAQSTTSTPVKQRFIPLEKPADNKNISRKKSTPPALRAGVDGDDITAIGESARSEHIWQQLEQGPAITQAAGTDAGVKEKEKEEEDISVSERARTTVDNIYYVFSSVNEDAAAMEVVVLLLRGALDVLVEKPPTSRDALEESSGDSYEICVFLHALMCTRPSESDEAFRSALSCMELPVIEFLLREHAELDATVARVVGSLRADVGIQRILKRRLCPDTNSAPYAIDSR